MKTKTLLITLTAILGASCRTQNSDHRDESLLKKEPVQAEVKVLDKDLGLIEAPVPDYSKKFMELQIYFAIDEEALGKSDGLALNGKAFTPEKIQVRKTVRDLVSKYNPLPEKKVRASIVVDLMRDYYHGLRAAKDSIDFNETGTNSAIKNAFEKGGVMEGLKEQVKWGIPDRSDLGRDAMLAWLSKQETIAKQLGHGILSTLAAPFGKNAQSFVDASIQYAWDGYRTFTDIAKFTKGDLLDQVVIGGSFLVRALDIVDDAQLVAKRLDATFQPKVYEKYLRYLEKAAPESPTLKSFKEVGAMNEKDKGAFFSKLKTDMIADMDFRDELNKKGFWVRYNVTMPES